MPLDLDKAVIAFREAVSRHNLTIPSVLEVLSNPLKSSAVLYLSKSSTSVPASQVFFLLCRLPLQPTTMSSSYCGV